MEELKLISPQFAEHSTKVAWIIFLGMNVFSYSQPNMDLKIDKLIKFIGRNLSSLWNVSRSLKN